MQKSFLLLFLLAIVLVSGKVQTEKATQQKTAEVPKTTEPATEPVKKAEAPKVEKVQKVEAPKAAEPVKAEAPKAQEAPKVEVPTPKAAEPVKAEAPKVEKVQKVETPKTPEPVKPKFDALNSDSVRSFLNGVTDQIVADRIFENNTLWQYPPHLGLRFISEYFVAIHYLGFENKTVFNNEEYKRIALSGQLENGSWKQLPDPMVTDGQIDSTIEAYWALKIMGEDINSPHMKKARDWILNYGGPEKSSTLTKYFLALFGQYDWENLLYIPLVVLRNDSVFSYTFADNFVGQWVYPHLVAMAYLRYYKIGADMGPRFSVQELYPEKPQFKLYNVSKPVGEPDADILHIIKLQLGIQQHNGGFGAYTVSSLLNMAALQDFSRTYPHLFKEEIKSACQRAFDFLEVTYVTAPRAGYKGMLMHGAWWDNTLIVLGLAEAKVKPERFISTLDHVLKEGQQKNGGICYGYGFEYAPDTDDTALAVMAMLKFGDKYSSNIKRAVDWLIDMQNDDGGFGAFHKNKNTNAVISIIAGKIADSAEIFDQSSVDLTAHILEAWADYGYNYTEPFVQRGINYIKRHQTSFGSWEARWATNYIHCAGNVISSLSKLGYNMSEPWIKKAATWMVSKQNEDGGFGETYKSYDDVNLAGVGVSTPTHTSWVLFGLIELADKPDYNVTDEIFRAINYLYKAYHKHGEWLDESPVGTGHRGILTMQYPAYAKSFPVMAISRYLAKFGEGKTCSSLNNYCRKTVIEQPEFDVEFEL